MTVEVGWSEGCTWYKSVWRSCWCWRCWAFHYHRLNYMKWLWLEDWSRKWANSRHTSEITNIQVFRLWDLSRRVLIQSLKIKYSYCHCDHVTWKHTNDDVRQHYRLNTSSYCPHTCSLFNISKLFVRDVYRRPMHLNFTNLEILLNFFIRFIIQTNKWTIYIYIIYIYIYIYRKHSYMF